MSIPDCPHALTIERLTKEKFLAEGQRDVQATLATRWQEDCYRAERERDEAREQQKKYATLLVKEGARGHRLAAALRAVVDLLADPHGPSPNAALAEARDALAEVET